MRLLTGRGYEFREIHENDDGKQDSDDDRTLGMQAVLLPGLVKDQPDYEAQQSGQVGGVCGEILPAEADEDGDEESDEEEFIGARDGILDQK